jgi:hypothetical protein
MLSLAAALRELRGTRSQRDIAEMAGMHLRSYTRLEQGAICRFPTIETILAKTGASPQTRATVSLAWVEQQLGRQNFKAVLNNLKNSVAVAT